MKYGEVGGAMFARINRLCGVVLPETSYIIDHFNLILRQTSSNDASWLCNKAHHYVQDRSPSALKKRVESCAQNLVD